MSEVVEGVEGVAWVVAASTEVLHVHGDDGGVLHGSSMAAAAPVGSGQRKGGGGLDLGQENMVEQTERGEEG